MNVLLFHENESEPGGRVVVEDYRAKHIVKVLGCKPGDTLRVGQVQGRIGEGRILAVKKKFPFRVELDCMLTSNPPPPGPIDVILAFPRPVMLKRIFCQLSPLGIEKIHIIQAGRVEKSFWSAGICNRDEYYAHLIYGLEQAVDTMLPSVSFYRNYRQFMTESLPEIIKGYDTLLLAHPDGRKGLHDCVVAGETKKTLLAIGAEGGWLDEEVDDFLQSGFTPFTIGNRILRVDTAVCNIHGRIMALLDKQVV